MNLDMKKSIFKEEYTKAVKAMKEIINSNVMLNEVDNIVTFIGEKGSGKSTILKSIVNFLDNKSKKRDLSKNYLNIEDIEFEILNVMDLKFAFAKESIVDGIIFNIYKKFEKKINFEGHAWKAELDELFNSIFEKLEYINDRYSIRNMFVLREEIRELIRRYLNYCHKDYIIIPIDNLNNVEKPEEVINDLKKYFRSEKVIFLLTLNKACIDERKIDVQTLGFHNNIIYIKPIDFIKTKLEIDKDILPNILDVHEENIFEFIQRIIMDKFKYYIPDLNTLKVLINNDISKLIDLIVFVNSVKTTGKKEWFSIVKFIENIIKDMSLGIMQMNILKEMFNKDIKYLNKYLLLSLSEIIIKKRGYEDINDEIEDIYTYILKNKFNIKSEKVSIGDIITCIKVLEIHKLKKCDENFIEMFKLFYTIRLLMEYDLDRENLITILNKDYIGDYFKLNSNIDKFNNLIQIDGKKSSEDLKYFFGYRKDLFLSVLEPCYDYHNSYSKFIHRDKNCFDEEDIYKQKYYRLRFLNILSYSVLTEDNNNIKESFILSVININYWMTVLESLDEKLITEVIDENEFIVKTIEYIENIMGCDKIFGYKEGNIINSEDVEFLQRLDNELNKAQYLYSYKV